MSFDPQAATAAYLATLSPQAHLKAIHYTQGGHWLLLWGWLVGVVAAVLIARSGLLRGLQRRLERRRRRPALTSFVLVAVFSLVDTVVELPWSIYAGWTREKAYGLTSQPLAGWLGEQVMTAAISAVITGLFGMALYALIRRAPRTWWAWAGGLAAVGAVIALVAAPVLIEPLFNRYTPAPAGPTRDAVVALAKVAGVPSDKIYVFNGSKQSNRYTANVSGLFGSARVAMSDTMFAQGADIAEVRGVVGHEMGHYVHVHSIWLAAFMSLLAMVAFWVIARTFEPADRLVGSGATSVADPVGLPTLSAVAATVFLLATPFTNTAVRTAEADADRFSLQVAHEPDGLSKALVKTIEYRASSPGWLEEAIFYDHPSVGRRIARAMQWKAEHLAQTQSQEAADARAGGR